MDQPTPVTLYRSELTAQLDPTPPARRAGATSHCVPLPALRLVDLIDVGSVLPPRDVAAVVPEMMRRHAVPFSAEILERLLDTVVVARLHFANRTLAQINILRSTGASDLDVLSALVRYLSEFFNSGSLY